MLRLIMAAIIAAIFLLIAHSMANAQIRNSFAPQEFSPWQSSNEQVRMTEEVSEELAYLFSSLKTIPKEEGRCLTGKKEGNVWVLDGVVRPPHAYSGHGGAFPQLVACPQETSAPWHNHPNGRCGLSENDKHFVLRYQFPIIIVQSAPNAWCWWTRKQVENSGDDPHPPVGQFVVKDND